MSLQQRYISKELTHFVGKGLPEEDQYELLTKILRSGWLTHPPHDPAQGASEIVYMDAGEPVTDMFRPQVVCFCDIPVVDVQIHTQKYSRFGLAFPKSFLLAKGANPVFYVASDSLAIRPHFKNLHTQIAFEGPADRVPRVTIFHVMLNEYAYLFSTLPDILTPSLTLSPASYDLRPRNRLVDFEKFLNLHVFSFIKFFDGAKSDEDPDNFYMEREWRIVGNLNFDLPDVCRVLMPQPYANRFREDVPEYAGQVTFVD